MYLPIGYEDCLAFFIVNAIFWVFLDAAAEKRGIIEKYAKNDIIKTVRLKKRIHRINGIISIVITSILFVLLYAFVLKPKTLSNPIREVML